LIVHPKCFVMPDIKKNVAVISQNVTMTRPYIPPIFVHFFSNLLLLLLLLF